MIKQEQAKQLMQQHKWESAISILLSDISDHPEVRRERVCGLST
jgi:hypothetical protein